MSILIHKSVWQLPGEASRKPPNPQPHVHTHVLERLEAVDAVLPRHVAWVQLRVQLGVGRLDAQQVAPRAGLRVGKYNGGVGEGAKLRGDEEIAPLLAR